MSIEELRGKLKELRRDRVTDYETAHIEADKLLIEYINDSEVTEAFEEIGRWYS